MNPVRFTGNTKVGESSMLTLSGYGQRAISRMRVGGYHWLPSLIFAHIKSPLSRKNDGSKSISYELRKVEVSD